MSPLAVDHLALPIYDAEKSLDFYERVLEFPLISALSGDDWDGKPWLMMIFGCADGRQVVLVALRGAEREVSALPRETRHFAFSVDDASALTAWKRRLELSGVSFWEEDHGTQRSVYFEDPNGIVLEITTPASRELTSSAGSSDAHGVARRFIAGA
jgi:catechol 2,3-dioxygenase-like lactoylglutathione lyase family enzyme